MITHARKSLTPHDDFRADVLARLKEANPRWMDLTPLIHERMKNEGKSLKYYTGILDLLAQKKYIELDLDELYNFEWNYKGDFEDFPLRTMITPEGMEEYLRIRKLQTDVLDMEYKLKRKRQTDLFAWFFFIAGIITTFLALAKTFHLFGL